MIWNIFMTYKEKGTIFMTVCILLWLVTEVILNDNDIHSLIQLWWMMDHGAYKIRKITSIIENIIEWMRNKIE